MHHSSSRVIEAYALLKYDRIAVALGRTNHNATNYIQSTITHIHTQLMECFARVLIGVRIFSLQLVWSNLKKIIAH